MLPNHYFGRYMARAALYGIYRFPAMEMKQIAVHYDWPLNKEGKGFFQKLFRKKMSRRTC